MISLLKIDDHSYLKNSIEFLRNEMIRVGIHEGITSEKTIRISQQLDIFIAKYQAQKNRK